MMATSTSWHCVVVAVRTAHSWVLPLASLVKSNRSSDVPLCLWQSMHRGH
jgi:hypothetical protein